MRLAGRLIDEGARPRDPVMLKVPPATPQSVPPHRTYVVVNAKLSARHTLQHNAEASGCNVEATGLNPPSVGIGHPWPIIIEISVADEVVAVSPARIETLRDAIESGYRHR